MAPVPPTSKIHLTRHAQAEHNVAYDYTIPDAPLTALGREQSKNLHSMTKDNIQQTADLLVSSVMRRPMETMLIGYADLQKRLEKEGKPPIILDTLQEVNHHACDTPTAPIEKLKESNGGMFAQLDFSGISPDYASKKGIFDPANVQQRAREVRVWLRERPEGEIVVVAHGDILRNIIDGHNSSRDYLNAEVKSFTFQSNDDYDAKLIEISEVAPEKATDEPTSSEMK